MTERTNTTTAKAEDAEVVQAEERELSTEELDEVSGGTGTQVINATATNTASGDDRNYHYNTANPS